MEASNRFVSLGVIFFIDQILVAAGNWLYWLIISKITTSSEIGQATMISSLVLLITTLTQLGLEYPILKNSQTQRSQILATGVLIQIILSLGTVPAVSYIINDVFRESSAMFDWIAISTLLFTSAAFVPRFALLGVSRVRSILVIDVISTAIKFVAGFVLVEIGLGALGMLSAILFQYIIMSVATLAVASKTFEFKIGNIKYFAKIISEGLANFPAKLARVLILTLSIVLLASVGIHSSDIGVYYVALMISTVAGSFAASIAFMVIPASMKSKTDLSSDSTRLGLSLTAPIISILVVSPKFILSLIGSEYTSGYLILLFLSFSILPYCIVVNTISKLNNLGKSKKLVLLGAVEVSTFLLAFYFLVPHYGTLGASIATLAAFIAASVPSLMWSQRTLIKHIISVGIALAGGIGAVYTLSALIGIPPLAAIGISAGLTMTFLLKLKTISSHELLRIFKTLIKNG
jgi:O-antigen/teichoic acid export membrane protein